MNEMSLKIRQTVKADMIEIVGLLQGISDYKPNKILFDKIWENFNDQKNVYSVVAQIDNLIVGYGAIVVEIKIRGGKMGHIEDIVSHSEFRKKGVGKAIVNALFEIAKENDCYKVALQCKEHNVSFYNKCNYELSGLAMQRFQ
ncbi:GNAT family N-acetyltransferase [Litorivicinus sp.]|nr:GNAT family N-acetyltransferase [Litorivicinus sp.]